MAISSDLIEKKKKLEQNLSSKLISQEIGPIHRVYLDLSVLQEIYIGAMLLLARTEKEYMSILSCITVYLSRLDNHICKYFKLDNRTDEDVYRILKDENNASLIFKASPFTNVWYTLQDIFIKIIEKNRVLDSQSNTPLEVCINTFPIQYPTNIQNYISNFLKKLNKSTKVQFIHTPIEQYEHRSSFDLYFLHDITPLVTTDNSIAIDFYSGRYESKLIFARRVISINDTSIDVVKGITDTRNFLNVFTTFSYLDVYIPGIKYNPAVIEEDPMKIGNEHIVPQ